MNINDELIHTDVLGMHWGITRAAKEHPQKDITKAKPVNMFKSLDKLASLTDVRRGKELVNNYIISEGGNVYDTR